MPEPIHDYDPAQMLEGVDAMAMFIADALETGNTAYISKTMDVVARAKRGTSRLPSDQSHCP